MKLNKNLLAFDYIAQSILIGLALITIVSAVVFPSAILFTMILGFFVGCWQVLSALILSIFTRNQKRMQYLLAVIAFFLNGVFISYFLRDYVFESEIIMAIIWGIIPSIYAFWYYKITYNDYSKSKKGGHHLESLFNEKEFV